MGIAISVVRLNPSDKFGRICRVAPVTDIIGVPCTFLESFAHYVTIGACGELHILSIFSFFYVAVLKHFAVDE